MELVDAPVNLELTLALVPSYSDATDAGLEFLKVRKFLFLMADFTEVQVTLYLTILF